MEKIPVDHAYCSTLRPSEVLNMDTELRRSMCHECYFNCKFSSKFICREEIPTKIPQLSLDDRYNISKAKWVARHHNNNNNKQITKQQLLCAISLLDKKIPQFSHSNVYKNIDTTAYTTPQFNIYGGK